MDYPKVLFFAPSFGTGLNEDGTLTGNVYDNSNTLEAMKKWWTETKDAICVTKLDHPVLIANAEIRLTKDDKKFNYHSLICHLFETNEGPYIGRNDHLIDFHEGLTSEQIAEFRDKFSNSGYILFIGSIDPLELREWEEQNGVIPTTRSKDKSERYQALRRGEFYVRMANSFELGEYVHCDLEDRQFSTLTETLYSLQSERKRNTSEKRNDLLKAIEVVRKFVTEEGHPFNRTVENPTDVITNLKFAERLENGGPTSSLPNCLTDSPLSRLEKGQYQLLRQLAVLSMLGKGERILVEEEVNDVVPWLEGKGGDVSIRRERAYEAAKDNYDSDTMIHKSFYDATRIQRRVEIYRDLGRWLSHGIALWVKELIDKNASVKVLVIDDVLLWNKELEDAQSIANNGENLADQSYMLHCAFLRQLTALYRMMGSWLGSRPTLQIDAVGISNWDEVNKLFNDHKTFNEHRADWEVEGYSFTETLQTGFAASTVESLGKFTQNAKKLSGKDLLNYDFILTDIVYRKSQVGAYAIRKVTDYLEKRARRDLHKNNEALPNIPRIVVLTRDMELQSISQCLDAGADLYLEKTRIFQLPVRMKELFLSRKYLQPFTRIAKFRVMDELLPGTLARLESDDKKYRISANDRRSKLWVQSLLKPDLHLHMGTCIELDVIEALALNTTGYLARNIRNEKVGEVADQDRYPEVIEHLRNIAHSIVKALKISSRIPIDLLQEEASEKLKIELFCKTLREEVERIAPKPLTPLPLHNEINFWDAIIERLTPTDRPIHPHEITGFIVSVISYLDHGSGDKDYKNKIDKKWEFLKQIRDFLRKDTKSTSVYHSTLAKNAKSILSQVTANMPLSNYNEHPNYHDEETGNQDGNDSVISVRVERRVESAILLIKHCLDLPPGFPSSTKEVEGVLNLQKIVQCRGTTLQEYLSGAGLLGAEHLQYPENIILATHSIVEQNIADNVIYSEVRCETTGYTRGGMSAQNATMTLILGFDLAAAIEAENKKKWVRTNVLLGAKRHKREVDISNIIQVLANELQRGRVDDSVLRCGEDHADDPPFWWRPSAVVGFDLSGDEKNKTHDIKKMREYLAPLYRESAPITIHAGEASNAETIWEAVFQLGARRIGHGLRLREQPRLLEHCVTRRICMEMCPVSNSFTNGLKVGNNAIRDRDKPGMRFLYPILYYLAAGMDVCINTDNRFIHPEGQQSVTAEFLKAAELTGYLKRSEVLSMVCAGFRNAFLEETDMNRLISHVENELYSSLIGGTLQYS